ncbi:MAG TPA: TlpA disulfide reductase family protein [Myxococcota bacterium]|nr:TlpA disulfide reductase family protein [Myxococcota bacterium]
MSRSVTLVTLLALTACDPRDAADPKAADTDAVQDSDTTVAPPDDTDRIDDTLDTPGDTDTVDTDTVDTDPVDPVDTDPVDTVDTDTVDPVDTDTVDTDPVPLPVPYGPPNVWWHADVSDVPPGLTGTGLDVGDVFPNFTLYDKNGDQVELYQFYGQAIMLDLFAMWCGPCQSAAVPYEAFWQAHQQEGFVLIDVMTMNLNYADPRVPTDLLAWEQQFGTTSPLLADHNGLVDRAVHGYPTFYLLNRDMTIAHIEEGVDPTDHFLEDVTAPWILEDVRDPEVCGDGVGNDADFLPDCADPDCASDPACSDVIEVTGDISPCYNGDPLTGVVDTFLITTDRGVGITTDTLSAATAFDMRVWRLTAPGVYTDTVIDLGDDEIPCTWQPPAFQCASGFLPAGTWEIVVDSYEQCADDARGEYVLRVTGGPNTTITPVLDDAPDFHGR